MNQRRKNKLNSIICNGPILRGFFQDNVTNGDIRLNGRDHGVTWGTPGSRLPARLLWNMYTLLIINVFMLQASDVAPFSIVSTHRDDLHPTEEIWERGPTPH